MIDFKLTEDGDLELTEGGDILATESVCQAVRVRLLWFLNEWRLAPDMGFPYFEDVFVKNPSESKIRHLIRKTVMAVDEVTDVTEISFSMDVRTRSAAVAEVTIQWQSTD